MNETRLTGTWRKASMSASNGGCVEVAEVQWRKARASVENGCVEVGEWQDGMAVRDSKNPDGPALAFTAHEWACFLDGVKKGEFDLV